MSRLLASYLHHHCIYYAEIYIAERGGGRGQEHVGSVQRPRGPSRGILGLRRRFYDPCMSMVRLAIHHGNTWSDEKLMKLA